MSAPSTQPVSGSTEPVSGATALCGESTVVYDGIIGPIPVCQAHSGSVDGASSLVRGIIGFYQWIDQYIHAVYREANEVEAPSPEVDAPSPQVDAP